MKRPHYQEIADVLAEDKAARDALDAFIPVLGLRTQTNDALSAYNGSLDAALALTKALLPGAGAVVEYWGKVCHAKVEPDHGDPIWANNMRCPARALLLATLRGYRAHTTGATE